MVLDALADGIEPSSRAFVVGFRPASSRPKTAPMLASRAIRGAVSVRGTETARCRVVATAHAGKLLASLFAWGIGAGCRLAAARSRRGLKDRWRFAPQALLTQRPAL
jgi:hypothetical protein